MAWTFHLSADGYPTTSDTDKRPRFFRVCMFCEVPVFSDKCYAPKTIA